jgi:multiple sugar transport system permease protein
VPYLLPAFIFIAALTFIPAAYTVYLSFTNASLIYPERAFIGFGNYVRLFADSATFLVLRNTFVFVAWSVVFQVALGLGLALLLNLPFRGRVLVRTLVLATWVIPEIVVGFTWQLVLAGGPHGLANSLLVRLGLEPVLFFSNGSLAMAALVFVNVWRGTAFSMILFLAALQGHSKELYEAARIDGGSSGQLLRFITLPMVGATVLITFINNTLQTFNVTALVSHLREAARHVPPSARLHHVPCCL